MGIRTRVVAGVVVVAVVAAWAGAAAPKVVKAVPDNGAVDVDPNLKEIRVTFDQAMDRRGYSWVGGGDTFPGAGKARWVDDRTCVMPAKLKPEHEYWIGVNSPSFKNFRSTTGEPAEQYPIGFTTGAAKGAPAAKPLTKEENVAAVAALKKALAEDYAYLDLPVHKVDWDAALSEAGPRLEGAKSASAFAEELVPVLGKANDIHIRVGVGERVMGTGRRTYRANFNVPLLAKVVPNYQEHRGRVATGTFEGGVGYVLIKGWDEEAGKELAAAYAMMPLCKAMIVERPNGGGGEDIAAEFAGCFVVAAQPYAKDVIKEGGTFSEELTRTVGPAKGRPHFGGKVAVLMGEANVSSNESFILMMKTGPECTTVGGKTGGASGRPMPHELGNGVTVFLPSWKDLRLDGTCIEGEGIKPDVEVKWEEVAGKDVVIERALALVGK